MNRKMKMIRAVVELVFGISTTIMFLRAAIHHNVEGLILWGVISIHCVLTRIESRVREGKT